MIYIRSFDQGSHPKGSKYQYGTYIDSKVRVQESFYDHNRLGVMASTSEKARGSHGRGAGSALGCTSLAWGALGRTLKLDPKSFRQI